MTFRGTWIGGLLCAAIASTALPALAQSVDTGALKDRIERLERDIRTLNIQIARGGGAPSAAGAPAGDPVAVGSDAPYARLSVRVSGLEGDLRSATGRIEEINYRVNQMSQQLDKLVADVDFRLRQLEGGGAAPMQSGMQQPMQPSAMTPAEAANAAALPDAGAVLANNGAPGLPPGAQVLGTLNKKDAAALPKPNASEAPKSEADMLLQQLTGDGPAITGASPSGAPIAAPTAAPAPKPQPRAAPAPAGVNVVNGATGAAAPQTASLPDGSPQDQYMHAFGLLRQGKYDQASDALRQFLEQHGGDKLASNARYWLGETYYVRGSFVEAAETFLEGYQADPKGPKAPDALLKLGMSLSSLDKKQEACAAFQKLRADYPDAPAGLKSTLQREWQKNGCV